jgi:hypothetical protein
VVISASEPMAIMQLTRVGVVEISVQSCVVGCTSRATRSRREPVVMARPRHTGTSPRAESDDNSGVDGTHRGNAMACGAHRKAARKAEMTQHETSLPIGRRRPDDRSRIGVVLRDIAERLTI